MDEEEEEEMIIRGSRYRRQGRPRGGSCGTSNVRWVVEFWLGEGPRRIRREEAPASESSQEAMPGTSREGVLRDARAGSRRPYDEPFIRRSILFLLEEMKDLFLEYGRHLKSREGRMGQRREMEEEATPIQERP